MTINLEKAYNGNSLIIYMIFRYSQYLLILETIIVLIYFKLILAYILLVTSLILILTLIILEITKKKNKCKIKITKSDITVIDDDTEQIFNFENH